MYRLIATILFSLLLCTVGAQKRDSYEAFKALVNTYPNTSFYQKHYLITTDSGKGLADTLGNILLPPHFEMSIGNDYVEFKHPKESAFFDRNLTLRQRGPYSRCWSLPGTNQLYFLFTYDHKGGVCSSGGKWLIPPVYDAVYNYEGFRWPLVLLSKNGRFGAIDTATGQAVVPFRFDHFTQPRPYIVGHISDSVVLYDSLGRMLAARPYHDIKYIDGHFIGEVHGMLAMLDPKTFLPVTPFIYKEFAGMKTSRYIAFKDMEGNFYGVMNAAGKRVVPERYDQITPLDGRSFAGHQYLEEVLFDQDFHELIPMRRNQFFTALSKSDADRSEPPVRDWIDVSIERETGTPWLWGQEDQDRSYLYNTRLRKAFPYVRQSRSYAGVYVNGSLLTVYKQSDTEFMRPLLMRHNGAILPITYRDVESLGDHALKVVMEDGRSGLLDSAGRWILKPEWESIDRIADNVFAVSPVRTSGKDTLYYKLVDIHGKQVSDIKFSSRPQRIGTGYWAESQNRWGLLDSNFQVTLPLIYDHKPEPFTDRQNYSQDFSRLLVSREGTGQLITGTGEVLLSVKDAFIIPWENVPLIRKRDSGAVSTRDGRIVTPFVHMNALVVFNHFGDAAIRPGDKWGILSHSGDTLQPFEFESVTQIPLQRFWVLKKGTEYTVVNSAGTTIASKLGCLPVRVSSDGRTIVCDTNKTYVKNAQGWKEKQGSTIATSVSEDGNKWKLRPDMDTIYREGQTVRIRRNGKMGLLDPVDLTEIIPAVWDTIYHDGGAENRKATYWVAKRDGKYSIVLRGGRILTDGWDKLSTWSSRLYLQGSRNGKAQLIYPDGKGGITMAEPLAPAPEWNGTGNQYIYPFKEGGYRGLYSPLERRILVPAVCEEIESDGGFFVCTNRNGSQPGKSVYNRQGQVKFRLPVSARLDYMNEGAFWRVEGYEKASALDTNGRVLVPGGYKGIWRIAENLFVVEKGGMYGIMNTAGKFIEPLNWDDIETLYTPLVGYRGDSVCLMQVKGQTIVKHCYEEVVQRGYFRDAKVYEWYAQKGDKWGIVRHDGTVVVPFKYKSYNEVLAKESSRERSSRY